jgi:hypothetical protein
VGASARIRSLLAASCAAVVALAAAGCGDGERQDADEPSATFRVNVVRASFPSRQRLAEPQRMVIAVRNAGHETVPDLAVSVDSFAARSEQPGLADPERAVWIVDNPPRGGDTAYVGTWALGPLRPGEVRRLVWRVTAVQRGTHTVRWQVAAGLNGKAKAVLAGNRAPGGSFTVDISDRPARTHVDPETGRVIRGGG